MLCQTARAALKKNKGHCLYIRSTLGDSTQCVRILQSAFHTGENTHRAKADTGRDHLCAHPGSTTHGGTLCGLLKLPGSSLSFHSRDTSTNTSWVVVWITPTHSIQKSAWHKLRLMHPLLFRRIPHEFQWI